MFSTDQSGWAEAMSKEDEETLREILARLEQRLQSLDRIELDHEDRLRAIERTAIQNAFVSSGITQLFWVVVAAATGFIVSHLGAR